MKWVCEYVPTVAGWVVKATGDDADVYTVQFVGPDAKGRACEYEAWKNAHSRQTESEPA